MKKTILLICVVMILSFNITKIASAESYTYDDNGKLTFIHTKTGFTLTRDENGNITGATTCFAPNYCTSAYYSKDDDGFITLRQPSSGYSVMLDSNEKVIISGFYTGSWFDVVGYEYENGARTKKITYNCNYAAIPTNCTVSKEEEYTYDTDEYGNITKEYINGQESATHTYSEGYIAKQKDVKCSSAKNCTSCSSGKLLQENTCVSSCGANYHLNNGHCFRVRYTPAELAKVVGESNTILLYYK